jgi:hypothetical protein
MHTCTSTSTDKYLWTVTSTARLLGYGRFPITCTIHVYALRNTTDVITAVTTGDRLLPVRT